MIMNPAVTLVPARPRFETTWEAAKLADESSARTISVRIRP
jgi:hypothetical protein